MMEIYENLDLNDLNGEEWKYIEEFEDYQISKFGRVNGVHHETISRIKNKKGRWIGENNE